MGANERRLFTTAVGITTACLLLYFMAGSSINTLSVYGRRATDWLGKAVGNVYDNGLSSKPDNTVGNVYGNGLSSKPDKTVGNVYGNGSSSKPGKTVGNVYGNGLSSKPDKTVGNVYGNGSSSKPGKTVGNVYGNGSSSKPDKTVGNVYGNGSSPKPGKTVGNVYGNGSSSKPDKTVGNVYDNDSFSDLMPKPILVIVWTKFWSEPWWVGDGTQSLRTCPELVGQCEFTRDHSRLKESDVLLFHMNDKLNLPRRHLRHQKWVFSTVEPPPIVKRANLPALQGVFNLTMTYARSAQVSWTYGRYELLSPETKPDYDKTFNFAANKTYLVAWFVSHCITWSRRETYVQALRKHINVHQYGCGGKYTCPRSKASECDRRLNDNYKFYLAFENSICRDYVTEKFWRILHLNVVPIVLGNASYSDILPPHSYIDVRDFPSPRHLAVYIKMVGSNDTLYNEYFRWRAKYTCSKFKKPTNLACNVCRHAVDMRGKTEIVRDVLAEWGQKQNCIEPKQFYRGMEGYL